MSKGPITVVIVEDDENAVNIYKHFTNQLDQFTVIATASTGKQALNILDVAQPDLILLDIFLPDMNGIELLREIRSEYRGIDVILITAANDTETVSEAIRGGAFGYLIKPIMIDKLLATLNQYEQTRKQLENNNLVNQEKVDTLFRTPSHSPAAIDVQMNSLPKGIDKHTLKMVRNKIQNVNGPLNADELGQLVGISYSTMRRYLEYLVSCNEMEVEVLYGGVGRPERKYKLKNR
ncbi:response regulator [Bacillus sp. mrc49]|uniref:response regulator n=1 Tax=Bacillus sp. mrc49 TaxID=2054913 RepID=UPI000C271F47|nr:response regulator [Bacillus sp. mrc49]PJN89351.1 response regulator [Bacillus sp. mrc49]